jgi:hypothetical protein
MDRPRRRDRACDRRLAPVLEGLEGRRLLSAYNQQLAAQAAIVRHEYDQYVGQVKTLELKSQATPSELLALRDDARAISAAASAANLSPSVASMTATDVSLQLDRSPLYGAAKDPGWGVVTTRLTTNLDALDVPQPLIQQTLADMKALATSAGVTADEFQTFTDDFNTLLNGESTLPSNPYYHFEDPGLFYTQHLRGFFRDWGVQKVAAEVTLQRDLRTIQSANSVDPAGVAVLHRDVHLLESLGAAVPSTTNQQLDEAYVAAFAQGAPTPQIQSELRTNLIAILGPVGTASRIAMVDRMVADAPAFAQATAAPSQNVQALVDDVATLVNAGGGETLNPFKVTIRRAAGPTQDG